MDYFYIFIGFLTGLVDSVVGGGGLISLPFLSSQLGAGAYAIGTNKILGTTGALAALIIYTRKGHLLFKEGLLFCLFCAVGSFLGSKATPFIPAIFFKYFMMAMCPVILYIIWNNEKFTSENQLAKKHSIYLIFLAGILSGFYDGFFGPGGGTFMFLSIFFLANFPLLTSIAISKMANTFSAGTALVTYATSGFVNWKLGLIMAIGMLFGSFIGASYTTKNSKKVIKPVLIIVVVLLFINLLRK